MLTLGIPTLNRYDLLQKAIESAEQGILKPDQYFIIDNGANFIMNEFYISLGERLKVVNYGENLGVAGSWNKIISETPDIRIISNDDVTFFDDTIKILVDNFSPKEIIYPGGIPSANSFSCYIIPDEVVRIVGLFDEKISPHYAYFEDNDYHRRMTFAGISLVGIANCRLGHSPSSTLKNFTPIEERNHHGKFKTAEKNYLRKWGGLPGSETLSVPREL